MGRTTSVDFNDVAIAANKLKAASGSATAINVRKEIGRGSMTTVLAHFQQWQSDQASHDLAIDNDLMDPLITRAINVLIATKVLQSTNNISHELSEALSVRQEIIKDYDLQTAELEIKTTALSEMDAQYAVLTGRAEQLESDLKRSGIDLYNERKTAELTKMELAVTHHKLETLSRLESEVDMLRRELKVASDMAAESSKVATVAEAKLEAAMANRQSA